MRGLVFTANDGSLKLREDLQQPQPKAYEVLVRVSHSGVCGTDLHVMQGHFPVVGSRIQLVLGHEFTGWLISNDGNKESGECVPVFVNPNGTCGFCANCQQGRTHFCRQRSMNTGGVGLARDGGWAELVAVPANQVHRLPRDLPLSTGILIEPISCVLHGYDRLFSASAPRLLDTTDSVLILGAGIIGLLWACLLHQRGHRVIDISDVALERRQAVENLKLDGVTSKQPHELPNNVYQLIVDCTGVPRALESAYKSLASGGILCAFGCAPEGAKLSLPYFDLVRRESTIVFCRINPFAGDRAIDLTYRLHREGYLDLDRLGIKVYPLDQHQRAFETLNNRQAPKVAFQLA